MSSIGVRCIPIRVPWCAKKITDRRIRKILNKDALNNSVSARVETSEKYWRALADAEVAKEFNREHFRALEARESTDPVLIAALNFLEASRSSNLLLTAYAI